MNERKTEFALPKCFSYACLNFKSVFDLTCLYIALYLVDNGSYDSSPSTNIDEPCYSVTLTRDIIIAYCGRYKNTDIYGKIKDALKDATMILKYDNQMRSVRIFSETSHNCGRLKLVFNECFSHLFDKTHSSEVPDRNSECQDHIRYEGFTLFDIKTLCMIPNFYQARAYEYVKAKTHIRKDDYLQSTKTTSVNTVEFYLALGMLTRNRKTKDSDTVFRPDNRLTLDELSAVCYKWKHVNETLFRKSSISIGDSIYIEASKDARDNIQLTYRDNQPKAVQPDTDIVTNTTPIKKSNSSCSSRGLKQDPKSFRNFHERQYSDDQMAEFMEAVINKP